MTKVEWLTVGILVVTALYTLATIALFWITRKSLEAMRKSMYGVALQGIAQNHREIAFKALQLDEMQTDKLQKVFMSPNPEDRELDSETRLFAGVLINHLETCFEHCRFGTIPDEFNGPLRRDISNTFRRIPALRRRWKEMREQLEPKFRQFIDEELKEEQK